jgi:putative endonuclease
MNNTEKGILGEQIAEHYLVKNGFKVLAKNYRYKHWEIDIVALDINTLVFVEVKTRKNAKIENPEDSVTPNKQSNLLKAAENYIFENNWQNDIRFDIISIIKNSKTEEIYHIKDAFH